MPRLTWANKLAVWIVAVTAWISAQHSSLQPLVWTQYSSASRHSHVITRVVKIVGGIKQVVKPIPMETVCIITISKSSLWWHQHLFEQTCKQTRELLCNGYQKSRWKTAKELSG